MRLVLLYTIGDGCTFSCDEVIPLVYKSAEDAFVDFEDEFYAAYDAKVGQFVFCGRTFNTEDFLPAFMYDGRGGLLPPKRGFNPPEILTVDEWFAREAIG